MKYSKVGKFIFFTSIFGLIIFLFGLYSQRSIQFYNGGDKKIRCVGRFDKTDANCPKVWAPGAYFEFDFEGEFCEIELEDELRFLILHNYIEVVIDGGIPQRIKLSNKFNRVKIGKDLSPGAHHVVLCKNTESAIGYLKLIGIRCAKLLPLKTKKKKLLEFIGDSITCGNGSDNSQIPFEKGAWYDYHNAYLSYGGLLARKLDAEYLLSAVSGIGLTQSCCGINYTMCDVYDRIGFDKKHQKWNFKQHQKPDIVFVTLGQNDGLKSESEYEKTYLTFLSSLRKNYKNSTIICCSSPMASSKFKLQLKNCIGKVAKKMQEKGDDKIFSFVYKGLYNAGYDKHPTIKQHQLIMQELHTFLQEKKLVSAIN